ncbi:MAG: hypothetical protein ABII10_01800 [Candidatus Paceibacterota bacterium]
MEKKLLLTIVGQTATGKTGLALKLAERLIKKGFKKVLLLSADSKQVFQGLEILTGADVPADFQQMKNDRFLYPYFQKANRSIELHGVACVTGEEEWSVAHFQKLFNILWQTVDEKTALIVVGGTGLYHQQIFNPATTVNIKPDQQLRKKLALKSLTQLQTKLKQAWTARWEKMNHSDRNNPRRLIRAIELASAKLPIKSLTTKSLTAKNPIVQIGLQLPVKTLQAKIIQRVEDRLEQGVMAQVKQFEFHHPTPILQAKASLGYQEINQYLNGKLALEKLRENWALAELKYAKRQQTWWRKQAQIDWFKADQDNLEEKVWEIITPRLK